MKTDEKHCFNNVGEDKRANNDDRISRKELIDKNKVKNDEKRRLMGMIILSSLFSCIFFVFILDELILGLIVGIPCVVLGVYLIFKDFVNMDD